jgi:hypothetical protein
MIPAIYEVSNFCIYAEIQKNDNQIVSKWDGICEFEPAPVNSAAKISAAMLDLNDPTVSSATIY